MDESPDWESSRRNPFCQATRVAPCRFVAGSAVLLKERSAIDMLCHLQLLWVNNCSFSR